MKGSTSPRRWPWADLKLLKTTSHPLPVPAGDTDGGRLATHILGREAATRLSLLSLALLGALGWVNQLADWWLPALLILHGSPPALCTDEVTPVSRDLKLAGLLCLCLPAAMLVPRLGAS